MREANLPHRKLKKPSVKDTRMQHASKDSPVWTKMHLDVGKSNTVGIGGLWTVKCDIKRAFFSQAFFAVALASHHMGVASFF